MMRHTPLRRGIALLTFTASLGFSVTTKAQNAPPPVPATVIVAQGDVLESESAETRVLRFGVPSINDAGEVAYLARLYTKGERSITALMAGNPAVPRVKTLQPAEGVENGTFAFFRDPVLDQNGNVAFLARVAGEGVANLNDYGIWFHDGEAPQLVAREGDEIPGFPGARFQRFVNIFIQDSQVLFVATLVREGEITKANDAGLWIWDPINGVRQILREGDPVLGLDESGPIGNEEDPFAGVRRLKLFNVLRSPGGTAGQGRIQLISDIGFGDPGATTVVWGKCTDGTKALMIPVYIPQDPENPVPGLPPTLLLTAARSKQPLIFPESGLIPRTFGLPAVTSNFGLAFTAVLASNPATGISRANNVAIFASGSVEEPPLPVVVKGDMITEGVQWRSFKDPILNDHYDLAWLGTLEGPAVTKETNTAIWHTRALQLELPPMESATRALGESGALVAREGMPVAGVEGAKWLQFLSVALPGGLPPNGPIFLAKIAADPTSQSPAQITSANDVGVWAVNAADELNLLLREGDAVTINGTDKTVKSMTLLGPVSGSRGMSRSFNAIGEVIVRARFTDGTQAIIKLTVPNELPPLL